MKSLPPTLIKPNHQAGRETASCGGRSAFSEQWSMAAPCACASSGSVTAGETIRQKTENWKREELMKMPIIGKMRDGVPRQPGAGMQAQVHTEWARSLRGRLALNRKDGSILVRIPAGGFEMGDGEDSDTRKHRVELSEYWIGVYCVTNRQYGKFMAEMGNFVPSTVNTNKSVWKNGKCPAAKLDHPMVFVSIGFCEIYAKWAGLSLPTEAQWEKAARGPGGLIYPWGNEDATNKYRNSTNKGSARTAAVWEYPVGASGYGTMQQAGNVLEWCADWYKESYYKCPKKDPVGPDGGSDRVCRGGGWTSWGGSSYFRGARRYGVDPLVDRDSLGFRLVRNSP